MRDEALERADRNLAQGLLRLAKSTTPHELEARGVRRVHSIGMREVSQLIEAAVNRTLLARTIEVGDEDIAPLVEQAGATLAELLSSHKALSTSRGELAARRAELDAELAELKRERSGGAGVRVQRHDLPRFDALLRETLAPLFKTERAATVARTRVLEALRLARTDGPDERDQSIELLERRVRKLVESLESAERALAGLRALGAEDPGLSSIYREVQGLESGAGDARAKGQMLQKLFEANLELRAQVALAPRAEALGRAPAPVESSEAAPA